MRKLAYLLLLFITTTVISSCMEETTWEKLSDYRKLQEEWLKKELAKTDENGDPYYKTYVAPFDKNAIVYMHFYNDPKENEHNLTPLYNSTVDVKYHGRTFDNVPFDSSYTSTSPADSVTRFAINGLISGWAIATMNMHVNDSVEVIMPYNVAYGEAGSGSINPYTHLIFKIKLVDIPYYQTNK